MNAEKKFKNSVGDFYKLLLIVLVGFIGVIIGMFYYMNYSSKEADLKIPETPEYVETPVEVNDFDKIENGIHVRTGLVEGEGLMQVVQNCTNCHSAKLVTQNRMSKERWLATIRWMQETQNLWNLGTNEEPILTYLSTYYAPNQVGRRANLTNVEWYELKD